MSKIIVCYLFTGFDDHKNIINFINHYSKYNAGTEHSLLICFKIHYPTTITEEQREQLEKIL